MLLIPESMPSPPGLAVPTDVYFVLDDPAPLAGMNDPVGAQRWQALAAAGLRHVVCLTATAFPYDPSPLSPLLAIQLEDLLHRHRPSQPLDEERRIVAASAEVARVVAIGEGVVVHCQGGTGRTGTVLGCALRLLGYPAGEIIGYLDRVHRARGLDGWPESSWQASLIEGLGGVTASPRSRGGR